MRNVPAGSSRARIDIAVRRLGSDQRAHVDPLFRAVPEPESGHRGGEFLQKRVVDAVLDEDTVCADTGLAGIAELADHRAGDGGVEIGIVEHDERRIAAELHRRALDSTGALLHQQLADRRRAGERQLANRRVGRQLVADLAGLAGKNVHDAGGNAGALGELGERERRQRRCIGGLAHDRAAGSKCRGDLPGEHRVREVPRRDAGNDAHRLLDADNTLVAARCRDCIAVDTLRFLREPLDVARAVGDFAARLGERLAHLRRQDLREILLVFHAELEPAPQARGSGL